MEKDLKKTYSIDSEETIQVKNYALDTLRADLVGIANIERFANAPIKMSPMGVMPTAKSVIVMAIHHPDTAIELGGIKHPQIIGPYTIQYHMNWRLDDMSYRMACFLEKLGWKAVPIVSSNIWRYRGYKDLTAQFAPDVSHIHGAVAAGLAEYGYSGIAITPEFGARVRYVTVITDAPLTPSPLLEPGSVCDSCMLCKQHCLSGALSKELKGWNIIKIEDKEYKYVNKNLWRCAWGEHFDLDLDLPIPEHVDEKVIMDATVKYGRRSGEFGSCLRYCVPKKLRYWDKDFTNAPRRRRPFVANPDLTDAAFHRGMFEHIRSIGASWGVDHVVVSDAETLKDKLGIDINALMPGAIRAISMVSCRNIIKDDLGTPNVNIHEFNNAWHPIMLQSGYDASRYLENFGYSSVQDVGFPEKTFQAALIVPAPDKEARSLTVLTNAPLPVTSWELPAHITPKYTKSSLTARIKRDMQRMECDLIGIAPASRIDAIVPDLKKIYEGEIEYVATNQADTIYKPYDPVIKEVVRHVTSTQDILPGAKSVIVLGMRMPEATVDITARTPAEAAGPYVFAQYETFWRMRIMAWTLNGILENAGYKAALSTNLNGTGSFCWNPRGRYPDAFSNTFAAVAAGLGTISECGTVVTPEFGSNVRFIAIVTDAELDTDAVRKDIQTLCGNCCKSCFAACKTAAHQPGLHTVTIDGVPQTFRKVDINRCNWAKGYSLIASEGNQYTGWHLDEPFPVPFTKEAFAESLRKIPQIEKVRPCNFEQCVLACPHSRRQ